MNINEFKCWLDGFSYTINECPTKEQWLTIKDKLSRAINEEKITEIKPKYFEIDELIKTLPPLLI